MATRFYGFVNGFVQWRWAPCVGLLFGALSYILLAVSLIPDQVGSIFPGGIGMGAAPAAFEGASSPATPGNADVTSNPSHRSRAHTVSEAALAAPVVPPTNPDTVVQGLMAPGSPLPTPEPPPSDPDEQPAPGPPPAPTPTIYTVNVPPPPPPAPPPVAPAPAAPAPTEGAEPAPGAADNTPDDSQPVR